ncbi:hypothetical protein ACEQ8H_001654 [Pleosporales sp. CAS-2024a]
MASHYARLLALWPKDALRPNLPFTRAIEYRGLPYGVTPLAAAPAVAKQHAAPVKARQPAVARPAQLEHAQVNALFSLLENRYATTYPLSDATFRPQSAPDHYDRLMREIERAPRKTWWQAKLDEWKMKIRWK